MRLNSPYQSFDNEAKMIIEFEAEGHIRSTSQITIEGTALSGKKVFHATEEAETNQVHPAARRLYERIPCLRYVPILNRAVNAYGPSPIFAFAITQCSSKGIADNLIQLAVNPLYAKAFKASTVELQRSQGALVLGWSCKVVPAMISDTFAIAGYRKRWYLVGGSIMAAIFSLGMGLLPGRPSSASIATGFLFLTCFGKALVDVLTEGHYSRMMRKTPRAGSALVSWVWLFITLGVILATSISGPLNDASQYRVNLYLSAVFSFIPIIPLTLNWYGEQINKVERLEDARILALTDAHQKQQKAMDNALSVGILSAEKEQIDDGFEFSPPKSYLWGFIEVNTEVLYRNWRVCILALIMLVMIIAQCIVNIKGNTWSLLGVGLASGFVLNLGCFFAFPSVVAKANLYMFLQSSAYLQFAQPLRSFYVGSNECVPNGPQFTYTFYDTVGGLIGNVAGFFGILSVPYLFEKRSYYFILIITTLVQIVASIFDLIIVQRWNRPHINDHVVYILGDAVVYQICYIIYFLPISVLMSRLCPRGSESAVYALLAGMSNMGQFLSNTIASSLIETVWTVNFPTTGICDYSNLKWLIILGHFCLPTACLFTVFFLIPSARMCDRLDVDGSAMTEEEYLTKFGSHMNETNHS